MRSPVARPGTPDLAQLEEIVRRKDRYAHAVRDKVHEAWALSYLAVHAFEASRADYSAEHHHEAAYVALGNVLALLEEAKANHDSGYTAAHRAVLDNVEDKT